MVPDFGIKAIEPVAVLYENTVASGLPDRRLFSHPATPAHHARAIATTGKVALVISGPETRLQAVNDMVLVIDDDPAVRGSLKFSLEVEGYTVRCYASPAEFLADSDLPGGACLVVDQKMPGTSGLDLLVRLAGERPLPLRAILITSYPSLSLRSRAQAAGIPIVEKPLMNNALTEAIRTAILCQSSPP